MLNRWNFLKTGFYEGINLKQSGNDTEEFMRDTLAPLISPGMVVYDELKRDIFGED